MSHSLRYAIVYQGDYPPKLPSAGARRVKDICRGLAAAGGDVSMLVPSHFGLRRREQDTFNVVGLGTSQEAPTLRSRLKFWSEVPQSVAELDADFTLFYDTTIDSIQAMRRIRSSGRHVGYELCDILSTNQPVSPRKAAYLLAERFLPGNSHLNIVITRKIADWIESVAPKSQLLLVPGLFDTDTFVRDVDAGTRFRSQHKVGADEVLVTYAGTWWKQKGVQGLIAAFAAAKDATQVPLRLVVAGKCNGHEQEDDAVKLVAELGLSQSVILPGFLNSSKLVELLSASDIVVSPSLDHPFNHAAFPTKVAEYAGMGCSILATAVGDIPHYFQDGVNAALCDPNEPQAMVNAIIRLAEAPELRQRIAHSAASTARQHFDFRTCGERMDREVRRSLESSRCA